MVNATIEQAMRIAVQHQQAGKLAEAESVCRQVLAYQPNHPDAQNLLGVIALQHGRVDDAIELIGKAIAAVPKNAAFHNNLGNAFFPKGDFDGSIAAFGKRCVSIRIWRRPIAI